MFNIDDRIKINEELCPENKRSEKIFQFGSLNYFAYFLNFEFDVVKTFRDDYHGEMIEVKVIDAPNFKSNLVFKADDCLISIKKMLKIDFEILGTVNKYQGMIEELKNQEKQLVTFRNQQKSGGILITNKLLIDNWNEIKKLRSKIKALVDSTEKNYVVKHKLGVFNMDCKEDDIPRKLRTIIRENRRDNRQLNIETKVIAGTLSYEKNGKVLTKPGKFLELNKKFANVVIKETKKPTTADNYVGIEIEMLSSKGIEAMNNEFIAAKLHRYVNIGTDASLRSDDCTYHPMELRVCLPENLLETHLKRICDVLRKNDCYANRTCGMHVHVDMRQRNPELCYKNFFKVQNIMLNSQPISRRNNKYCVPNTKAELKLDQFDHGGDTESRRSAINTQSYNKNGMKTIEIRIHEGATKFKDIYNWVKFLTATASLKEELPSVAKDIKDLRKFKYLDESVVKHLDERIEEYSA